MDAELDLTSLKRAAEAFTHAINFARKIEAKSPEELEFYEMEFARAAVIQHFEFTYELCWKTMKRYIEIDIGEQADILTRRDLFRQAGERGLIDDFHKWVEFNTARNRTSHIYDEKTAIQVYNTAKEFQAELNNFIAIMETRV